MCVGGVGERRAEDWACRNGRERRRAVAGTLGPTRKAWAEGKWVEGGWMSWVCERLVESGVGVRVGNVRAGGWWV